MKPTNLTRAFTASLLGILAFSVQAAPDEELLGKSQGYPIGKSRTWFYDESVRVGSFSNMDKILPFRVLEKSPKPNVLKAASGLPDIRYIFDGKPYSIDDFLNRQRITGLLIIKDGLIQVERYQYDRKPTDRFLSNSMAKSITSLAIGLALEEGKINSLDDKVSKYVPELAGCAYGEASLRNTLRMASGVKFVENYSGDDDLQRFARILSSDGLISAICAFREHDEKEGEKFHYATSQTYVLGLVIKGATGQRLSVYVDSKIWKPMGAEADAFFNIDKDGQEMAGGNFNAVLRDYGRLGMLLANDGLLGGAQILPKSYLLEATDWHRHPEAFAPGKATPAFGYGYQFWILPGEKRRFALIGVFGQTIYVDPESKLVMVQTAAANHASVRKESLGAESYLLWNAVLQANQPASTISLPVEIKSVLDAFSEAWSKQDLDGVMSQYHSDYSSSAAKNHQDMRRLIEEKFFPYTKHFDWKVAKFRLDGNKAYISGMVSTDAGTFPFAENTQLLKVGNRWYIYGDRNAAQK